MSANRESVWQPGKLWSLWDVMKRMRLDAFWMTAASLNDSMAALFFAESDPEGLPEDAQVELTERLNRLGGLCKQNGLQSSVILIDHALNNLPKSHGEMNLIWMSVKSEMEATLFLSVTKEKAPFYNMVSPVNAKAMGAFPNAAQEIVNAGNAFVADLPTGSVYYSMRALEHGLRALAADVGAEVSVDSWHTVIERIEAKVSAMRNLPRGEEKAARLQFLSEAAAEFRYFKDGWRNYASHVKVNYDDNQAVRVLQHVGTFIELLSTELKEAL